MPLLRALLGDPEMMRHLGGPESPEALASRHARYLAADSATNSLFTVLVEESPAGWVGFWESEWDGALQWECGWHVLPAFQGRGVATEAVRQMLAEARARKRHRFADAFPSVENAASNAVCRRLVFVCLGEVEIEYPKGRMMRSNHWRLDLEADFTP